MFTNLVFLIIVMLCSYAGLSLVTRNPPVGKPLLFAGAVGWVIVGINMLHISLHNAQYDLLTPQFIVPWVLATGGLEGLRRAFLIKR